MPMSRMYFLMTVCVVILLGGGCLSNDSNAQLEYGESGYPKNCRAIITANMDGYHAGIYTAEEALGSIDRNCGAEGYSWEE